MRNKLAILALPALLAVMPLSAQDSEITYKSTELASGMYMLEGQGGFGGGNMTVSIGGDGVVLIDDGLPPLTDTLLGAIGELTKDPVAFVVNTHAHGDHVGGNEALGKKGATIVAHDNLRRQMIAAGGEDNPTPKEALPVLTFSDAVTFHLNGREAFVFHVERAHTDGDLAIHFVKDNVIHAGDVFFNGLFPYVDLDGGGSVEGFIAAQTHIISLSDDKTKIVPGHGPLANKKDLQAARDMLADALERVRKLVRAGKSEEEILETNPLADYHDDWNWGFISTERMTKTLIRELMED
jgi:glyoxylase-like metal-dependent hydrolase (beta-lactamase superfamily II)